MIVKRNCLKIFVVVSILLYPILFSPVVEASSPSFQLYPSSGVVKSRDEGFIVDVLIDSGEYDLSKARMVVSFNPEVLQIFKASKNNSLFDQWPEDESTLDNTDGVVMLTGFTQSGGGVLYKTLGDPDVFVRLEFEIVAEGDEEILLDWEFSGSDDLFKTVLVTDGSPPYNVLTVKPKGGVYRFGELIQTALERKHVPFLVGGFLILSAGILITSKPEVARRKFGTVVVYEE
ncbi:hypothetical protein K8R20_03240 [bacterium]|nr:hypothetical protein [bacterium]